MNALSHRRRLLLVLCARVVGCFGSLVRCRPPCRTGQFRRHRGQTRLALMGLRRRGSDAVSASAVSYLPVRAGLLALAAAITFIAFLPVAGDAATWSIQVIPAGRPSSNTFLDGVACPSRSVCMAVGYSMQGSEEDADNFSDRPLTERWNGSAWKPERVRVGKGWSEVYLDAVSCSSANACTAVGDYYDAEDNQYPLVERWNGSSWSRQIWPGGPYNASGFLDGISCSSASNCTAVGQQVYPGCGYIARWASGRWSGDPLCVSEYNGGLEGVSCYSKYGCAAVGSVDDPFCVSASGEGDYDMPVLGLFNRNSGSFGSYSCYPSRDPSGSTLTAVSCPSATACTAVGGDDNEDNDNIGFGSFFSFDGGAPLVARWNGHEWSLRKIATDHAGVLNGVSCASSSNCIAVGAYQDHGIHALLERWHGSTWTRAASPLPADARNSGFDAVACQSPQVCAIVGSVTNRSGHAEAIAEWTASAR
jgi:hypothetical protein